MFLAACSGTNVEQQFPQERGPTDRNDPFYRPDPNDSVFGNEGFIFGAPREAERGTSGIGVNSFLWRASLDTVSFMPLASADPFGGVIITDWYTDPQAPSERVKVTVYILDQALRANALRVNVYKQQQAEAGWIDTPVGSGTATQIEDAILTRARELRIAQGGPS